MAVCPLVEEFVNNIQTSEKRAKEQLEELNEFVQELRKKGGIDSETEKFIREEIASFEDLVRAESVPW
jgi:argininosuccinate lyase